MKKATAAVTNSFISVFPEHKGITRILLIPIGDQTLDSFEFEIKSGSRRTAASAARQAKSNRNLRNIFRPLRSQSYLFNPAFNLPKTC